MKTLSEIIIEKKMKEDGEVGTGVANVATTPTPISMDDVKKHKKKQDVV